ncbi:MAG: hypothetical protein ACE5MH_04750 [Terriglobia bacterium]
MGYRNALTCHLLALSLLLPPIPLCAQQAVSLEISWRDWTRANQAWLRGQITPNRVVPEPHPARRRLLVSYDIAPEEFPQGFHRSATYDNALAALAFLISGETDAAAFTLHALARQVRPDGSLWFGYNTTNSWPDERYHESAIVRAGAVGWVGYAFTFYLTHAPACVAADRGCARERVFFQETAERLANYLLSLQVDDPADSRHGLLRLGYATIELAYRAETDEVVEIYLDEPALGISAENNISAWFFFRQLGQLTGEARWSDTAERIRHGLLRGAWNETLGQFNRGFHSWGAPDPVKALDCASWGVLFLLAAGEPEQARRALEAIEAYYPARDGDAVGYGPYFDHPVFKTPEVGRHFFPDNPRKEWRDLSLVWSEGTLGVALAYLRMGQAERARGRSWRDSERCRSKPAACAMPRGKYPTRWPMCPAWPPPPGWCW